MLSDDCTDDFGGKAEGFNVWRGEEPTKGTEMIYHKTAEKDLVFRSSPAVSKKYCLLPIYKELEHVPHIWRSNSYC
jgi:hypothetical protein